MFHTLESVFNLEYLRKVWLVIRNGISDDLVRDPLDYLAYEANLDSNLKQLRHSIVKGRFTPRSATILRSAKRDGLTRPLSFLEIEDLIVLKSICDSLQPDLHRDFPEYVDFSRRLRTAFPRDPSDYEGWFEHWLRHQNRLTQIVAKQDGWKVIVFADISNFFSSINHAILRQTISSRTETEETVINLLFYILEAMIARPDYRSDHRQGLPQENHDASRILAHSLLYLLDSKFEVEGEEGRYARWVDDIVVAVDTKSQGRRVLARIQEEIESRGLFLNTAKCRIIPGEKAIEELWLEENKYLDEVHQKTNDGEDVNLEEFEQRLEKFLNSQRKENWDRILKRYYTESRRTRSSYLERLAWQHINEFPSAAKSILAYLEARPFNKSILEQTTDFLRGEENCYPDVEILTYEFLMKWNIPNEEPLREACWKSALNHFFGRQGYKSPHIGYVRGLISLLCYKVGGRPALAEIARFYEGNDDLQFLRYAFCCLAATEDFKELSFKKAASVEDISIRRLEKLFRDLEKYSCNYLRFIKKALAPIVRKVPERAIMEPRALPLVRICRRDDRFRSTEWVRLCERTLKKLESPPDTTLHDHLSIAFLWSELRLA